MPWRQISFDLDDDLKDAILGELNAAGASGVWESDTNAGKTRILAFFPAETGLHPFQAALQRVCGAEGKPVPEVVEERIEDRDWNEEWKKSYTSFPLGTRFFVVPSWSRSVCPPDRHPIFIDPGQAFGTGTHETTQLTLEALERRLRPQDAVLDLGTGSGILAIAASILGARTVIGCDNDPVAAAVARENTERNRRDVQIFCGSADAILPAAADLLLCNVTAEVIVSIFTEIDRIVKPGGMAVFSGILNSQRSMILNVMAGFRYVPLEENSRGEWVVWCGVKHGA